MKVKSGDTRELVRFVVVGSFSAGLDLISFIYFFNVTQRLDLPHPGVVAKGASLSIALIFAFLGHDRWSFVHEKKHSVALRVYHFILLYGLASVLQVTLIFATSSFYGENTALATITNGSIILGTTVLRFFAAKFIIFSKLATVDQSR